MKYININKGFTLIEMLVALAMVGILAAVAMPSFMDTIGRTSVSGATRSFTNTLSLARGESITRGINISICPKNVASTDCAAGAWSDGWIVFVDNNSDATGSSGSVDTGGSGPDDEIVQVYEPLADIVLTGGTNLIQYNSRGFGLNSGIVTFKFCPQDNNVENARSVEIGMSGRARLIEGGLTCP